MPERVRAAGILALVLALVAYAYAPLLGGGPLGEDLALLDSLEELDPASPADWYAEGRHPGGVASLLVSGALWTEGAWTVERLWVLRFENLTLLVLAALGLLGAIRRALEPWAGADLARAAGRAGAGIVLLHPLLVAAVARPALRGDFLALALGAWAAHAFLVGRQEKRRGRVTVALVLTALAGACSDLALFLPFVLAVGEYESGRRLRPRRVRVRTTVTTLVVFLAAALLEVLPRLAFAPAGMRALLPDVPPLSPERWLERVGVLLMPGNVSGLGPSAPLLAALASLIALHPALVAARTAPRLWTRVLLAWAVALVATVVPWAGEEVDLEGLAGADVLLPAAVVMGIGLGVSSVALSGWRRTFVPLAIGGMFALLGRAQSVPQVRAASVTAELREDLLAAARARSWSGTLLLIDPPRRVAGLDPVGPRASALLTPALPPREQARGVVVRASSARAFELWSRLDEFEAVRRGGVSLVVDRARLEREEPGRTTVSLLSRAEDLERATWLAEHRSPSGEVYDPLLARHLTVVALPDVETQGPPVVRWSTESSAPGVEEPGVWLRGDGASQAHFDLERRWTWLLGGRVRSVWLVGGLSSITAARLTPGPPALEGPVPRPVGEDWTFDATGAAPVPRPLTGELRWRLEVLDVSRLEVRGFAPSEVAGLRLRFPGVDAWATARQDEGAELVWFLDLVCDGVPLARASGRL